MKTRHLILRILLWAAANTAAGAAIGLAIAAFQGGQLDWRIIWVSVLFGNVVGFTAIVSAVYVFPRFLVLPGSLRMVLQVTTLLGVSVLGTGIVIATYPLFFLHDFRTALRVLVVNGVVATILGTVLFSYETLRARLAESLRIVEEVRLKEADLRAQAARAQLAALQARIKPHFFFNTLNTISALVVEDPDRAEDTIALLADLFRYTLKTSGARLVPFGDEVRFVESYLMIEKARFGDRLQVTVDVAPETTRVPVPGLILQPIVENAVIHAIAPRASGGRLRIHAWVEGSPALVIEGRSAVSTASESRPRPPGSAGAPAGSALAATGIGAGAGAVTGPGGDRSHPPSGALVIDVEDDGPGPRDLTAFFQDGHALANVRDRLATLYSSGEGVTIAHRDGGGTRVRLRVPLESPWTGQPVPEDEVPA